MIYILFYAIFIFLMVFAGICVFIFFKHTLEQTVGKIEKEPLKTREVEVSLQKILPKIAARKTSQLADKGPHHKLTESTKN